MPDPVRRSGGTPHGFGGNLGAVLLLEGADGVDVDVHPETPLIAQVILVVCHLCQLDGKSGRLVSQVSVVVP